MEPKPYWPLELREIAAHLQDSFEKREEAVFSQLARGVVHDLRTLLHAPMTATHLTAEAEPGSSKRSTRLERLFSVCSEQFPKIKTIIDNTLDGSRSIDLRTTPLSLDATVENAIATLGDFASKAGVKVTLQRSSDQLLVAHDPIYLERALANLIKNGIEATESAPTKVVRVTLSTALSGPCVEIEDSGPGLRVDPNQVIRPLRSTKVHGSGLGLTIAKKIVIAHHGDLTIGHSESLNGAKITVSLPRGAQA
jgi:two-component system sensor histidine kinase HydH